jgi:hypothetical protein
VRLALALALTLAADPAAACHRFSVWHYPWRQSCNLRGGVVPAPKLRTIETAPGAVARDRGRPTVALPSLARGDLDAGEADEPIRAHVLLRAALEGDNR